MALSATPNVISSELFMRLELHSVYDQDYFGVQVIENVIFLHHFRICDPNQVIEKYKHWVWNNKFITVGVITFGVEYNAKCNNA